MKSNSKVEAVKMGWRARDLQRWPEGLTLVEILLEPGLPGPKDILGWPLCPFLKSGSRVIPFRERQGYK